MIINSQAMKLLTKITSTNDDVSLYNTTEESQPYVLKVGKEAFKGISPSGVILAAYNSLFADTLNDWRGITIRVCNENEYMVAVDEQGGEVIREMDRLVELMVTNPSDDFIQKLSKLLYVSDNTSFRFEKQDKTITLREKKATEHFLVPVVVNTKIKDLLDDADKFFTLRDRLDVEVTKRENEYNKSTEVIYRLDHHLKQLLLSPQHRKEL